MAKQALNQANKFISIHEYHKMEIQEILIRTRTSRKHKNSDRKTLKKKFFFFFFLFNF